MKKKVGKKRLNLGQVLQSKKGQKKIKNLLIKQSNFFTTSEWNFFKIQGKLLPTFADLL